MGVRLQPQTEDRNLIEDLAGVPRGTYDKLDEFEAKWPTFNSDPAVGYQRYSERKQLPFVDELYQFILFGWGKVDYRKMDEMGFDPEGGRVEKTIDMKRILAAHLPDDVLRQVLPLIHKVDALSWC